MLRRIRIYLFGVILGSILVYFMLIRNREKELTKWLPENRVLEEIHKSKLIFPDKADCYLECSGTTRENVKKAIEEGDINFSRSSPRDDFPVYLIESGELKISIELVDSTAVISKVNSEGVSCECDE